MIQLRTDPRAQAHVTSVFVVPRCVLLVLCQDGRNGIIDVAGCDIIFVTIQSGLDVSQCEYGPMLTWHMVASSGLVRRKGEILCHTQLSLRLCKVLKHIFMEAAHF